MAHAVPTARRSLAVPYVWGPWPGTRASRHHRRRVRKWRNTAVHVMIFFFFLSRVRGSDTGIASGECVQARRIPSKVPSRWICQTTHYLLSNRCFVLSVGVGLRRSVSRVAWVDSITSNLGIDSSTTTTGSVLSAVGMVYPTRKCVPAQHWCVLMGYRDPPHFSFSVRVFTTVRVMTAVVARASCPFLYVRRRPSKFQFF